MMLKLKLQYFGHLVQRADSLEKTLMLGKIEGKRKRGWKRIRCLDGIINSMDMTLSKFWEMVKDRKAWHAAVHGVTKSLTRLSGWTTTTTQDKDWRGSSTSHGHQELGEKHRTDSTCPPSPLRMNQPCWHLPSRIVTEWVFVDLIHSVCSVLLWWP